METYDFFYRAYKEKLFSYLMRMTGDRELSFDIMQEAFTRHLESYSSGNRSASMLYTIARNALIDNFRKAGRIRHLELDPEDISTDHEHQILVREECRNVLQGLLRLDQTERDLLSLAITGDLSYRDIASITGTSEVNVKVKIHRARTKLKQFLSGDSP